MTAIEAATARLEARFVREGGRTRLAHCFCAAPLKIAKTFPLGEAVSVCVMDASPGLLAGDHYELSWQLDEGAHVHVTTQGFTRVHPAAERPCLLRQQIRVADGALLEYFPEPLMLFQGAALRAENQIDIARGGTLLLSEIVCAGRILRGEAFQFHSFSSRLRVRCDNELIFVSQTGLRPRDFNPRALGSWQDFTHQANFTVFSERANDALRDALREVLEEAGEIWGGVSLLERHGVVVSLLGRRAWDLQQLAQRLRETARSYLREEHRDK